MKKVILFSTLILCLMVSATFVKAESTESIYNKLQVNASCDGDLFKVEIIGNYYKITTSASCSYTQNQTYTILNKPNYSYCTMYLYADIIKTTFYFEQYQQWWFGNQKLWDSNIDVIILNNMRRVTIYE